MRCVSLVLKGAIVAICAVVCASCGPHMVDQPSIKPYERRMPSMPSGVVPTTGRPEALTAQQATSAKNPLPVTHENLRLGRIYYGYYCLMCHGERGDGNGPVGESYVPKPTDLASPAVARLTDSQIYARMLTGEGHDPVMSQTVLPENRWPLVMYIRTFAKPKPAPMPVPTAPPGARAMPPGTTPGMKM